jgi:hypothetical protein
VSQCDPPGPGDWRGTLRTLLVTFCIVIIRCTETFRSTSIFIEPDLASICQASVEAGGVYPERPFSPALICDTVRPCHIAVRMAGLARPQEVKGPLCTLVTRRHPSLKIHVAVSCTTPVALFSSEDMFGVSNKAGTGCLRIHYSKHCE